MHEGFNIVIMSCVAKPRVNATQRLRPNTPAHGRIAVSAGIKRHSTTVDRGAHRSMGICGTPIERSTTKDKNNVLRKPLYSTRCKIACQGEVLQSSKAANE